MEDPTKVPNLSKIKIHSAINKVEHINCNTEILENLSSYMTNNDEIFYCKKESCDINMKHSIRHVKR